MKKEEEKSIIEFVKKEPRAVQEISQMLGKSWVTANNYVREIKDKTGIIDVKVFRGNTKGSLKIVYWNYSERLASDEIKDMLYDQIRLGKKKEDFEPLDIYENISRDSRNKLTEQFKEDYYPEFRNLPLFLKEAKNEVLCFSGNLSWINQKDFGVSVYDTMKSLAESGVRFKVLCRVDIGSMKNIDKILTINKDVHGAIEIRHRKQPLRGFIVDDKAASFAEEKKCKDYKKGELEMNQKTYYDIYDDKWVNWLKKVFWDLYRHSSPAEKRIENL